MKEKKELFVKDSIFHFYNRTVENEKLFRERDDYIQFLKKLKNILRNIPASIYAYCLMPNHFHFLLKQNSDEVVFRIFNSLLSSYVQKYNRKYNRKGALLGGPLQSKLLDNDIYILNLCRYIHMNPVKANLVRTANDWEFSNYAEWVGKRNGKLFNNDILKTFYNSPNEYEESINDYNKYRNDKNFTHLLFDNNEDSDTLSQELLLVTR